MSDWFNQLEAIARYGEIAGISAGGLIVCASLFYFVATARPFAIAAALTLICSAISGLYWFHVGRADVMAQWDAANVRAAAAAVERDTTIEQELDKEFPPDNAKVDPDEAKILADLSAAA